METSRPNIKNFFLFKDTSLKLTVRTWKMAVGSFTFGTIWAYFQNIFLLLSGRISVLRKSGTPQTCTVLAKSNIDTKNDGVLNVSPFKYGYFGYPAVSFVEVPLYMVFHPSLLPAWLWRRWWNSQKGKWRNDTFTQVSAVRVFGGKGCQEGLIIRSGFFRNVVARC